jgi:diadenosine tetraphosphatase ApaH/serine/threonine PP2A family protein phosphatase
MNIDGNEQLLAVISDAHGNVEALDRVLEDMDRRGIRDCVCLGDIVGYGPEPEACVRRIRERGIPSVLGNHEQGLRGGKYLQWFNPPARKAVEKTRTMLSDDSVQWLRGLPETLEFQGMLCVHGCPPDSVNKYLYTLDEDDLAGVFRSYPHRFAFAGHTHELNLYSYDGSAARREEFWDKPVPLEPDRRYLVNAGAVGQPRDGDNRAKYVLLDREKNVLQAVFVPYDVMKTVNAMRALGLNEGYVKRLL